MKHGNLLPLIRAGKNGVFVQLSSNWRGTVTLNDLSGKVIQKCGIDTNGNAAFKVNTESNNDNGNRCDQ